MRKVNEIVWWSSLNEHGALAHGFLALESIPSRGTERSISGIANTCEAVVGSIACAGLPSSTKLFPMVPLAWEMNGFRRPV